MANDRQRKTVFFGLLRKNKDVVEKNPALEQNLENKTEEYKNDIVLLTKKLDSTMEIPSQGIRNLSDGDFDENYQNDIAMDASNNAVNQQSDVVNIVNEIAEDVIKSQEPINFANQDSASNVINEVKAENENTQQPIKASGQDVPIFNFHVTEAPSPQQESPSLNDFTQNTTTNTNISPDVNELIYDEQSINGPRRH